MYDFDGAADHLQSLQHYESDPEAGGVLPALLLGGLFLYFIYLIVWYVIKSWSNPDVVDENLSKNRLALAYISLSAQMLRKEVADVREKTKYIQSYIHNHFPNQIDSLSYDLNIAIHDSVPAVKTALWIKTHLNHKDWLQVLYFLAGLAFVDGRFNTKELTFLRDLQSQLELSPKEYDQVIAMYTQR